MTIFRYKTKVGDFYAYPTLTDDPLHASCVLTIGDEPLGRFETPREAIQAIFNQETGFLKWDQVLHQEKYNFRQQDWETLTDPP